MNHEQTLRHLKRANEVAKRAASLGRHPFGAILVAPDGETVLAEQGNIDTVHHAEATLARTVSLNYSSEFLWDCTPRWILEVVGFLSFTWLAFCQPEFRPSSHCTLAAAG